MREIRTSGLKGDLRKRSQCATAPEVYQWKTASNESGESGWMDGVSAMLATPTAVAESKAPMHKINLTEKFTRVIEHWRPKVIAELNGQEVKVVKCQGTFVWHHHEAEDEMFLVWRGRLRVEFRDRVVDLQQGEFLLVPRGVEHRTVADEEVEIVLFEPAATRNTGNVTSEVFTAPMGESI
jgi:mannose-6-phosphate isomerase-like protein (cupin superfamily)